MLFYATPVLYSSSLFPENIRWVLYLNPMAGIIDAYRNIFIYHQMSSFGTFAYLIGISIFVFAIGLLIFRKLEKGFAEEL